MGWGELTVLAARLSLDASTATQTIENEATGREAVSAVTTAVIDFATPSN